MAFELAPLPYAYDALEPHIDARTMEIHHTKHHNAYTTNLNAAIAGTDLEGKTIENILINLDKTNGAVRNNGGGFYNHNLFWSVIRRLWNTKSRQSINARSRMWRNSNSWNGCLGTRLLLALPKQKTRLY